MSAPGPRRDRDKPRRESIEKPPPRPERKREPTVPDDDPSRSSRDEFDPNVNSTRT